MRERLLERTQRGALFQRRELILRHLRHLRVDAGGFGHDVLERRRLFAAFLDGGVRADDAFGARELFIDARDFGGRRRGIGDERGDERVVTRGDGLQTSLQRGGHDCRTSRAGRGGALAAERSRRRADDDACDDDACDDDARGGASRPSGGKTRRGKPAGERDHDRDHDHDAPTRSIHGAGPSSPAQCHPRGGAPKIFASRELATDRAAAPNARLSAIAL